MKMKDLILKELEEIACGNTGTCQINLQSQSARELIVNKLEPKLQKYMQEIINKETSENLENLWLRNDEALYKLASRFVHYKDLARGQCCGGGCHEG